MKFLELEKMNLIKLSYYENSQINGGCEGIPCLGKIIGWFDNFFSGFADGFNEGIGHGLKYN